MLCRACTFAQLAHWRHRTNKTSLVLVHRLSTIRFLNVGKSRNSLTRNKFTTKFLNSTSTAAEGATASEAPAVAASARLGGIVVGSLVFCAILYATRLKNPLYPQLVGEAEYELQLAESESRLPITARTGDSRSAVETMTASLRSMEKHAGNALVAGATPDVQDRVKNIRKTAYTNAIKINLKRAEDLGVVGRLDQVEKHLKAVNDYAAEGGVVDVAEYKRVVQVGFSTAAAKLFGSAQTYANQGDVSKCTDACTQLKGILGKASLASLSIANLTTSEDVNVDYTIDVGVTQEEVDAVLGKAHEQHVQHLLYNARQQYLTGSRVEAKGIVKSARDYAGIHGVGFDENAATKVFE